MRRATCFLVASLALILTSCSRERSPVDPAADAVRLAQSEGTSITVVGQNDPALDVPGVQSAVDNYDTVILSGDFDFGRARRNLFDQRPLNVFQIKATYWFGR